MQSHHNYGLSSNYCKKWGCLFYYVQSSQSLDILVSIKPFINCLNISLLRNNLSNFRFFKTKCILCKNYFQNIFFTWRRASILVAVIRAVIVAITNVDLGEQMKLSKRNKNLYILIYTKYGRFYVFLIWHDLISNSFIMIIYATRE